MQHVLRCWERQSDLTTQYKKTLRRPGLRPDPARGAYNVATNTLAGVEGLAALPKKPILGSPTPTPKLVPTPLLTRDMFAVADLVQNAGE